MVPLLNNKQLHKKGKQKQLRQYCGTFMSQHMHAPYKHIDTNTFALYTE